MAMPPANPERPRGLQRNTGRLYYLRSLAAFETGDLENALLDVSEAIHYDRRRPEYYSTRGIFFINDNRPVDASRDLEYALKLNRRDWLGHFGLGILRFLEGDVESALAKFDQTLRINLRRPEVWFYRGVTLFYMDQFEQAGQDLDKAIGLFKDTDKRLREAKAWKKEIEAKLKPPSSRARKAPKKDNA
jgi:tetratricopeptide (TPR) repeat protein